MKRRRMLKRIKSIKNVGTLVNVHAPKCELRKISIIYGGNSYGKSTLCDILSSLKNNDNTFVEKRKTVNSINSPQIEFSFSGTNELPVAYKNGVWIKNGLDADFEIFDTDFVHRNVFTNNSTIEHANKENFTEFVIGDEAVKITQILNSLNERKKELDREKKIIESKVASSGYSLSELLKIKFKEDIKDDDTKALGLKTDIAQQMDNKSKISEIKALSIPIALNFSLDNEVLKLFTNLNKELESSFSFEADDLISKYNEHKRIHFYSDNDADIWLQKGTDYCKDNICPYCGQSLDGNELIESYLTVFSKEFKDYNSRINKLRVLPLNTSYKESALLTVEQNADKINRICSKVLDSSLNEIRDELNLLKEVIVKNIEKIAEIHSELHKELTEKVNQKKADKFKSIEPVCVAELVKVKDELDIIIKNMNDNILKFNEKATVLLSNLSVESIDNKIKELTEELDDFNRIVCRNKFSLDIERYLNIEKERSKNRTQEKQKKEEFDKKQSDFLDLFFKDIEETYKLLGSRNYNIEREEVKKGINKTYSLSLKYKGNNIASQDIKYVLSESDKRALALAIFLSKIKRTKSAKTILVLDDPISSFDIDRMQAFTNILKSLYDEVDQIIILTHYQNFYKMLASWTSKYLSELALLKIVYKPDSNDIQTIDRDSDELLMDEYQKSLFELISFINGDIDNYNAVSARIFMQKFIEYYFMLEIKKYGIMYTNLDQLLQGLKSRGIINHDLYKKLDIKREEYNASAHEFDSSTDDSKRNSLVELYDMLHSV